MFKKIFLTSFLLFSIIGVYYPSKRENTRIFDYCYSLEKILSRNSIEKRKNISEKVKSLTRDMSRLGVNKTKGSLINKIINQYKTSKNSLILNVIPNKIYCLSGYWVEKVMPGTFESVIYDKGKKKINAEGHGKGHGTLLAVRGHDMHVYTYVTSSMAWMHA